MLPLVGRGALLSVLLPALIALVPASLWYVYRTARAGSHHQQAHPHGVQVAATVAGCTCVAGVAMSVAVGATAGTTALFLAVLITPAALIFTPGRRVPLKEKVHKLNEQWDKELPATGGVSIAHRHVLQWTSSSEESGSGHDPAEDRPTSGYLWVGQGDDELLQAKKQLDHWVRQRRLQPLAASEDGCPSPEKHLMDIDLPGFSLPPSLRLGPAALAHGAAAAGLPADIDLWFGATGRQPIQKARLLSATRHEVWLLDGEWQDDAAFKSGRLVAKVFCTTVSRWQLRLDASRSFADIELAAIRLAAAAGVGSPPAYGHGNCRRSNRHCSWAVFGHLAAAAPTVQVRHGSFTAFHCPFTAFHCPFAAFHCPFIAFTPPLHRGSAAQAERTGPASWQSAVLLMLQLRRVRGTEQWGLEEKAGTLPRYDSPGERATAFLSVPFLALPRCDGLC